MDAYLSEIRIFPMGYAPRGWAQCNGQLLAVNTNQALFSLLGTYYGGDGRTTFALPNLQGSVMLDDGTFNGANYTMGMASGSETVTLLATQMPQHIHMLKAYDGLGSQLLNNNDDYLTQLGVYTSNLQSPLYAVNGYVPQMTNPVTLQPNAIASAGGSQPHNNMQPYLALNVCMCISGVFPSRD